MSYHQCSTFVNAFFEKFSSTLGEFPDGRIDYSHSDKALVLTCFVQHGDKILLLKRSQNVKTYKGKWQSVAGYIDERIPLRHKILEELDEEIGVIANDIARFIYGKPYVWFDPLVNTEWYVCPSKVVLRRKPKIVIDWEHVAFRWIRPEEIVSFDAVASVGESWKRLIG